MKIALIGSSGFAEMYYYRSFRDDLPECMDQLVGIIDPNAKAAPAYPEYLKKGIPLYDSLSDFYAKDHCDLLCICSPTRLHKEQILEAYRHGSTILCEKPITTTLQEAEMLQDALEGHEDRLGIGFQWSYTHCMLNLKKDILNGKLGKPIALKSHISWQRINDYYLKSPWHGRIRDSQGRWVLDSIVANAVAHYLHNMFFILGPSEDESLMPEYVEGSVYRGKPWIESFDTCFLRGKFENGAEYFFTATHSGEKNTNPRFEYTFENGSVYFDEEKSPECYAIMKDGTRILYGCPQDRRTEGLEKIRCMMDVAEGKRKPSCLLHTVLPHLTVSNAILDFMHISDFPEEMRMVQESPAGVWIRGLYAATEQCYQEMKLPDEKGWDWAAPSVRIDLKNYHAFEGKQYI